MEDGVTEANGQQVAGEAARPAQAPLLDAAEVAGMLKCSERTVYRLAGSGRMPKPIRLGGLVRWRRQTIEDWIGAGCPPCDRPRGRR